MGTGFEGSGILAVGEFYNPVDDPCPCCSGLLEAESMRLCDGCFVAAFAGIWPHGCPGDAIRG